MLVGLILCPEGCARCRELGYFNSAAVELCVVEPALELIAFLLGSYNSGVNSCIVFTVSGEVIKYGLICCAVFEGKNNLICAELAVEGYILCGHIEREGCFGVASLIGIPCDEGAAGKRGSGSRSGYAGHIRNLRLCGNVGSILLVNYIGKGEAELLVSISYGHVARGHGAVLTECGIDGGCLILIAAECGSGCINIRLERLLRSSIGYCVAVCIEKSIVILIDILIGKGILCGIIGVILGDCVCAHYKCIGNRFACITCDFGSSVGCYGCAVFDIRNLNGICDFNVVVRIKDILVGYGVLDLLVNRLDFNIICRHGCGNCIKSG